MRRTAPGYTASQGRPPAFCTLFRSVDDSRLDGMVEYPLVEILLLVFLAVLANASTWADIAHFAESKKRWLKKFVPLKNGVPSHDTFRRVFSLIDPLSLQQATVSFLMENMAALRRCLSLPTDGYRLICVDGKEEKGTGRKYGTAEVVRNLQTLHVYDATHSVCLFSQPIDSKTNEIPDAREIASTFSSIHVPGGAVYLPSSISSSRAGSRSFFFHRQFIYI